VLVHGDLSHLNFMVEQHDGRWAITGLLDWGDVKVGPWTHELISPAVHMYLGDRDVLRAWYGAYGRPSREMASAVAHVATARAMLYYAEEFNGILGRLPGGESCRDWPAVARCLWQLDEA
jgi:aminoglycoside phosphotransferase (APT) family kinase protein